MGFAFDVIAKHVTLGQAELLLGEARTGAAELDTSTRIRSQCGKDLCIRQSWNQGSHKPFNKKWGERCPFSPLFGDITVGHRRRVRGRHDGKQGSFTFCLFNKKNTKHTVIKTCVLGCVKTAFKRSIRYQQQSITTQWGSL